LDNNLACAAKLQAKRFTIDCTIKALEGLLKQLIDGKNYTRQRQEEVIFESEHFCALIEFLANQLNVLVLDPKLFRMDETWHILCEGVNCLLSAIVNKAFEMTDKIARVAASACGVAHVIVDGARSLGLQERQLIHRNEISDNDDSVFRSAQKLASDVFVKKFPHTQLAAEALASLVSPLKRGASFKNTKTTQARTSLLEARGAESEAVTVGEVVEVDEDGVEMFDHAAMATRVKRGETISEAAIGNDADLIKYVPPGTMVDYFYEAIDNNPLVINKLLSRKFQLVTVLETAAQTTGEAGAKNGIKGADGEGSVTITWDQIVMRMVKYMREHNYDSDETTCLLILKIFRFHLLKARSTEVTTIFVSTPSLFFWLVFIHLHHLCIYFFSWKKNIYMGSCRAVPKSNWIISVIRNLLNMPADSPAS
jgi:hypothetical protein